MGAGQGYAEHCMGIYRIGSRKRFGQFPNRLSNGPELEQTCNVRRRGGRESPSVQKVNSTLIIQNPSLSESRSSLSFLKMSTGRARVIAAAP